LLCRPLAHFRFQIVDGELYIERNWQVMEFKYMEYLRFYFSVWGILQLLRRYPGQVSRLTRVKGS
jgi:hypothetical protein